MFRSAHRLRPLRNQKMNRPLLHRNARVGEQLDEVGGRQEIASGMAKPRGSSILGAPFLRMR